ncbi:hypothetical protein Zmor_028201 [Zophobas morio]|uniref:Uncharacterized protein n=1 Tax=Zophobas morio TaxID=2755281 RepID=A0AA38HQE9_9CUCU|nr:hypothetical protein Zmor_028201 [Zophobas morio]
MCLPLAHLHFKCVVQVSRHVELAGFAPRKRLRNEITFNLRRICPFRVWRVNFPFLSRHITSTPHDKQCWKFELSQNWNVLDVMNTSEKQSTDLTVTARWRMDWTSPGLCRDRD